MMCIECKYSTAFRISYKKYDKILDEQIKYIPRIYYFATNRTVIPDLIHKKRLYLRQQIQKKRSEDDTSLADDETATVIS